MRRAILRCAAGVLLAAGLAAPAFAASGEEAFAQSVASCMAARSGDFADAIEAGRLGKPRGDEKLVAHLEASVGPVSQVASDGGRVYIAKGAQTCDVWAIDVDPAKAVSIVAARVERSPYRAETPRWAQMMGSVDPLMRAWLVPTSGTKLLLSGGRTNKMPARVVFMTVSESKD